MKDIRVIDTKDGSQSLFVPELNETYHSTHGAAEESEFVFIENGLAKVSKDHIRVFEVGFGTGLNALLAWSYAKEHRKKVYYESIEFHPLSADVIARYNQSWLMDSDLNAEYVAISQAEWNHNAILDQHFTLKKVEADWLEYKAIERFDIIFYDAFAPSRQGEMWELSLLEKSYTMLHDDGLLVTYCAQGQFRRNLKDVGFKVERLPGPPGKREMIRAEK